MMDMMSNKHGLLGRGGGRRTTKSKVAEQKPPPPPVATHHDGRRLSMSLVTQREAMNTQAQALEGLLTGDMDANSWKVVLRKVNMCKLLHCAKQF